ncbi:MAG: polysaccharide biosynthesis tyrosine autokinase [Alphaproteobacteria bacterium]
MTFDRITSDRERVPFLDRAPFPDREPADEIDWRDLARSISRSKWWIASLSLTLTVLIVGILAQFSPRYTAETLVGIDVRRFQAVDIKDVVSTLPADVTVFNSEVEIARSRALAERVVQKLKLMDDPEFNELLVPANPSLPWQLDPRHVAPELWRQLFPPPTEPERILTLVVDKFLERLNVQPKATSYVFSIQFISENANQAALIANTIADIYISEQEDIKREGNRRANTWLEQRVSEMLAQVQVLDRNVDTYRQEAGLIRGRNTYVSEQQLAELNSQLVLAKSRRAEAEARYRQVTSLIGGKSRLDATTEVLASPLIQRLREKEAEVQRNESQLLETYGPKHPKVVNNQAEMRDLRRLIDDETRKIAAGLANELDIARANEQSLMQSVAALERRAAEIQQAEIKLNELQREADAARALYETFLARLNETTSQTGFQRPDARIVTRAGAPEKPTFPNLPLFGGAALLGSLFVVSAVSVIRQRTSSRFQSVDQVDRMTGLPTVALLPRLSKPQQTGDHVIADPRSDYAEAIHGLLAGLRIMDPAPCRSVLITSALRGEGKSQLAVSMARIAARTGRRVVLIDADLRDPRLHGLLGASRDQGLAELLAGQAAVATLQTDDVTGLQFLSAGGDQGHPADLLARPKAREIISAFAAEYDLVIIDSPPVLSAIDAQLLGQIADRTIFVLEWEKTSQEAAEAALRLLYDAGASLAGIALSKIDLRKSTRYGDVRSIAAATGSVGQSGRATSLKLEKPLGNANHIAR